VPTITDLLEQTTAQRREAERRQSDADAKAKRLLAGAEAEGRKAATLTDAEAAEADRLIAAKRQAKEDISRLDGELEAYRKIEREEADVLAASRQISPTPAAGRVPAMRDGLARVGMEERTYRPDRDRTGRGFLLDVSRQFLFNDVGAGERLSRHTREEAVERGGFQERAVGTGAYTGLVVPQYLTDFYAPATAALRPIADVATPHDLPEEGMTLNISRITTPTSVALQATEGAAVSETNLDDTILTINVQTAAGQQTISRQAIERGTGVEDVTLQDLYRRYATNLDGTLITQASTGLAVVAQGTTYTDASPTAAAFWPFLFQAQSKLEAALLGQAMPDYIAMHSRRWNWLCSQVGTSFPFIGSGSNAQRPGGVIITNEYGAGVRGILSNGMKVVVDNNIETNVGGTQDPVYVLASGELHLWENPNAPMLIRAEGTKAATLEVLLVVYSYFGYTASRYANNPGRITGTGLVAPSGF
jgi:hypothetical protein